MSKTIYIPLHLTQYKAIQNIHMGRDVRSDIPEEEAEAFKAIKMDFDIIYEYMVNKYPDVFPDGTEIIFEEVKSVKAQTGTGKILGKRSKMTTTYLGAKARVVPSEAVVAKVEEAPKKEVVSESGAVQTKVEEKPVEAKPLVVAQSVVSDTGAVNTTSSTEADESAGMLYEKLKPYEVYTGKKIEIRKRLFSDWEYDRFYYDSFWSKDDTPGHRAGLHGELYETKHSFRGGDFGVISSPFSGRKLEYYDEMGVEIKHFLDLLKDAGSEFRSEWYSYKIPLSDQAAIKARNVEVKKYQDKVRPIIDSFEEYIRSKYVFVDKTTFERNKKIEADRPKAEEIAKALYGYFPGNEEYGNLEYGEVITNASEAEEGWWVELLGKDEDGKTIVGAVMEVPFIDVKKAVADFNSGKFNPKTFYIEKKMNTKHGIKYPEK